MATYSIRYTDINVTPIIINQGEVNTTAVDVALFGRIDLEYGQLLNENLLHLLENFACPEDPNAPGTPDLTVALSNTLYNPTDGQIWFNSTQQTPFIYVTDAWVSLGTSSDFAANSGKIYNGQQLPLPVSTSGYQFTYDECVWLVSPSGIQQSDLGTNGFSYMVCTTNDTGLVIHTYAKVGTNVLIAGVANYIIIGMKKVNGVTNPHNHNYSEVPPPPPPPPPNQNLPSPTPTNTPVVGATVTPTPTITLTVTPTVTVTPTMTATPTPTPAPSVTPSPSPIIPITATLFISPSVGYANTFGASSSTLTQCVHIVGNNGTVFACNEALGVVVTNLAGGSGGPYTITWNLNYFYSLSGVADSGGTAFLTGAPTSGTGLVPWAGSNFNGSTSGYSCFIGGQTVGVFGGQGINTQAYCQAMSVPLNAANSGDYVMSMTLLAGSFITISDGSGNSTRYYTPGGSGGQVQGSQLTSAPSSNYSDSYNVIIVNNTGSK